MKIRSWDEHSSVENKGTTLPSMISRKERFHQLRFAHIGSLMNIYHGKICQTSPYINKQTSKQANNQTTKQTNQQTKILVSHFLGGETSQPTNQPPTPPPNQPPATRHLTKEAAHAQGQVRASAVLQTSVGRSSRNKPNKVAGWSLGMIHMGVEPKMVGVSPQNGW